MTRAARALTALAALALVGAAEPRLVPDISARSVEIRYSFSGAQLLLFGAIVYPGGRLPDRPADVVVVLRGPTERILIRQKKKVAGVWMNAASHRFSSAPSFYAVASSRPVDALVDARTANIYELGVKDMQLSPGTGNPPADQRAFEAGLVDLRRRQGLYVERPGGVEIADGVLYRARIDIPSQVPVGDYVAETYLVSGGKVIAAATRDVHIAKAGFERYIGIVARRHGFAYGLAAVLLSLGLGAAAAWAFRRRG